MIKRLFSIISCIIFSVFIMSCSLLSPRGYCDVQFQVPARTGTTNTDNVIIWHVVVTDTKTGNEIHNASYHPGDIVTLDEVLAGKYDIKIFGSNGDAIYSKAIDTNVKPGKVNKIDVTLEKQVDIITGLKNLGILKSKGYVLNSSDPENYVFTNDDSIYAVPRLYVFESFNNNFTNILNSIIPNEQNYYEPSFLDLPENKYGILVIPVLDAKTLEITKYIVSIKYAGIEDNSLYYSEELDSDRFYFLTKQATLGKFIEIKNNLSTYDTKLQQLGTNPKTLNHESLIFYYYSNQLSYTRFYKFDNNTIKTSLLNQFIDSNIPTYGGHHFGYLRNNEDYLEVEALLNPETLEIENYQLYIKGENLIPHKNGWKAVVAILSPERFDIFVNDPTNFTFEIKEKDPYYQVPELHTVP